MKTPGFISFQKIKQFLAGIFRPWPSQLPFGWRLLWYQWPPQGMGKDGKQPRPWEKKRQRGLRIDKGYRSYLSSSDSSYLPSYLLLPLVIFIYAVYIYNYIYISDIYLHLLHVPRRFGRPGVSSIKTLVFLRSADLEHKKHQKTTPFLKLAWVLKVCHRHFIIKDLSSCLYI